MKVMEATTKEASKVRVFVFIGVPLDRSAGLPD